MLFAGERIVIFAAIGLEICLEHTAIDAPLQTGRDCYVCAATNSFVHRMKDPSAPTCASKVFLAYVMLKIPLRPRYRESDQTTLSSAIRRRGSAFTVWRISQPCLRAVESTERITAKPLAPSPRSGTRRRSFGAASSSRPSRSARLLENGTQRIDRESVEHIVFACAGDAAAGCGQPVSRRTAATFGRYIG